MPFQIAATDNELTETFKIADDIKSTDFARFTELLQQIESEKDTLSAEQLEELSYLQAYHHVYAGNQKEALVKTDELIEKAVSDTIRFKSYGLKLNTLVVSRKYSEVFGYFDSFNSLLDKIEDDSARSYGLIILTLVFNQINQFELGLDYAEMLLDTTKVERYRCIALQFKLESLHRLKRFDEFNAIYEDAVNNCAIAKQPVYVGIIHSYKVEQLLESSPAQALKMLNSHYSGVQNTSYNILVTLYQALYTNAYLRNGQPEVAIKYGESALDIIAPNDINYAVLLLYSGLYEAEKRLGNYDKALNYYEVLVDKQKAYDDEKTAGLVAYNIARANIGLKNKQIELLNKDNELLFLQTNVYEQEVKQTRVLTGILGLMLFVSIVLAYKGISGRRRFKKIAEYDQLTGISNRYHFNNQAWVALNYCEKNNKPASVILFDLDYFKSINDMHGHSVGDWALQAVVKTCRNFMRNNDVFGRIGGEEFAVVLPGCQTDKAILLAEICRDAISAIDSSESGKKFPLSASFGVAGSDSSGYQLKQLLADADHAMYKAKAAGRDTVASFVEES